VELCHPVFSAAPNPSHHTSKFRIN
jgi:hypothetical protein